VKRRQERAPTEDEPLGSMGCKANHGSEQVDTLKKGQGTCAKGSAGKAQRGCMREFVARKFFLRSRMKRPLERSGTIRFKKERSNTLSNFISMAGRRGHENKGKNWLDVLAVRGKVICGPLTSSGDSYAREGCKRWKKHIISYTWKFIWGVGATGVKDKGVT